MRSRRVLLSFLITLLLLPVVFGSASRAQAIRIDGGGGWAIPTTDDVALPATDIENLRPLTVELRPGPHGYVGVGFVRSISDRFALGARVRGHASRLRASVDCGGATCRNPEGDLRAVTVEGRIIVTSPDWIHPYLLVGLGVVHTTMDAVTVRDVQSSELPETVRFSQASVVDAGGDVGVGASLPIAGGLYLDAEIRAAGALPGGKENTVTTLPFSLGLSYEFD